MFRRSFKSLVTTLNLCQTNFQNFNSFEIHQHILSFLANVPICSTVALFPLKRMLSPFLRHQSPSLVCTLHQSFFSVLRHQQNLSEILFCWSQSSLYTCRQNFFHSSYPKINFFSIITRWAFRCHSPAHQPCRFPGIFSGSSPSLSHSPMDSRIHRNSRSSPRSFHQKLRPRNKRARGADSTLRARYSASLVRPLPAYTPLPRQIHLRALVSVPTKPAYSGASGCVSTKVCHAPRRWAAREARK